MSVVREQGLDHEYAEDIFRSARNMYSANPYNTAIVWYSPLDEAGERDLRREFSVNLGRWISAHGLSDGLAGLLHQYLRDEIVSQLSTIAPLEQRDVLVLSPEVGEVLEQLTA